MAKINLTDHTPLIERFRGAMGGMSDKDLARELNVSPRTMTRYKGSPHNLAPTQLERLTRRVFERDPLLAVDLARAGGTNVVKMGLAKAHQGLIPGVSGDPRFVDAVLCVAAEVANLSPAVLRPALHRAMRRAQELGLDLATIEAGLAQGLPPPPKT